MRAGRDGKVNGKIRLSPRNQWRCDEPVGALAAIRAWPALCGEQQDEGPQQDSEEEKQNGDNSSKTEDDDDGRSCRDVRRPRPVANRRPSLWPWAGPPRDGRMALHGLAAGPCNTASRIRRPLPSKLD